MNELEQLSVEETWINDKEQIIDQVMQEYSDGILYLVFTYVKNRATAEDLTQEIFIKCYEKLDQFNKQASIKTWVYRIASNHCKDYLGSWHYRKIKLNEKVWDYIPSKSKQVEEEVISKNQENSLSRAIMALPIKYREVVFLHYYEELSLEEISKVTTININTIKTRLKRAKELLRDKMMKEV
ncbi:sigma-70 family RNA polymerase sigma factor [Aquibacillus rhizosphaerae]|uniref:Sigma-70 family RNA polymerase sigma factor n=1 Tax=Aquibacillus rhizosphaerae TaxID=3051431 RepID=A0ABT7L9A8_9BACI|nr:sigma-70 family RNA polymerase sigma factor [Aquibacillus sp. LR5S19]MDL4842446.1 sigma-70 family RNA polymerase sigma factor [Aquibacillus sp. LR5S19]